MKANHILRWSILCVALGLLTADSLQAQEIIITDFEDGYLSWTNEDPSLYYTVQFRPNLVGEEDWDGAYRGLQDLQSADAIITVPVSMFWRVVGTASPQHTRTLSAGSTILNAGYYEATDLTTVAPSLSAENIRAGVSIFGVEGNPNVVDTSSGDAEAGNILTGRKAWVAGTKITGTIPDRAAMVVTPSTVQQEIQAGYHNGEGYVAGDASLLPENIRAGVIIFGVQGTYVTLEGMVLISGGTNSGTDPDYGAYSLTVDSFRMDKYLVTKGLWDDVRNDPATEDRGYTDLRAGGGQGIDHPVQTVSWFDAVKWLNARSELAGREPVYYLDAAFTEVFRSGSGGSPDDYWEVYAKTSATGYRLPTMDQWEYAARGGLESKRFPWGDRIDHEKANYRAYNSLYGYDDGPDGGTYHPKGMETGSEPYTTPVDYFPANGYGLHDVAGNLFEWNYDWHPSNVGSRRVIRGAAWSYDADRCRVGRRSFGYPSSASVGFGFRAVLPTQ